MAPALPEAPRELDPCRDTDADSGPAGESCRRRALTSVDNVAPHMDDDAMGLHAADNLAKDSQEMEQILVELGGGDLGQVDLLQAIKTMETGGDSLSTGDPDAMFPLPGFDLAEVVDADGDAAEDKVRLQQARLERRCSLLLRRLRILQARAIGKRVSEEASQMFEKCAQAARREGVGRPAAGARPIGVKALLKRIETTAALQANAAARSIAKPSYFHAGTSSKGDAGRPATIGVQSGTLSSLEETAGALRSHLAVVKHELDSDATDTSSGAESNDEAVAYNNPHQQHMPIEKRALWSWQRRRASIASRWGWLQAQVQELDYKIRQHTDLHKQVRQAKGAVQFEGEPSAYSEPLPGASHHPQRPDDDDDDDASAGQTCARVRPLRRDSFKKRKLLQMHSLHHATEKAARPADIRCGCQWPISGCAVCTGRAISTQPPPPPSTLSSRQRLALLDPAYHNPLSDIADLSPSIHMAALSSRSWFRSRCKSGRGAHHNHPSSHHHHHSQPGQEPGRRKAGVTPAATTAAATPKLKRGRPPLSRKIRESEESHSNQESNTVSCGTVRARHARLNSSYDIDNIVIPQSVAANTRPEILHYKEIVTPKWRVLDTPQAPLNNGIWKGSDCLSREIEEELSEAAVATRHLRAEARERSRYMSAARGRRSHHNSLDAPLAPPAPAPAPAHILNATAPIHETVRPFTPRQFPLADHLYESMVRECDAARAARAGGGGGEGEGSTSSPPSSPAPPPQSAAPAAPHPADALAVMSDSDTESSLSAPSPFAADGDDPRDAEWEPSAEKHKRSKFWAQ